MESVSLQEIVRTLRAAGVRRGDVLNVHSRLFAIGAVRDAAAEEIPALYLRAFREVIGEAGTIVVPTFTTSFGRFGAPFVLETSPSEMGVFSEHVRTSPGAVRSLHPIQSLGALGHRAAELAADHPAWNVGHDTVWDRMLRQGGKFVGLGISPRRTLSFMHQAEFLACVPYLYHKVLRGEIYAGGGLVERQFLMAVRYLQYEIAYDLSRLEADLTEKSAITQRPLGGDSVWVVPLEAAFEVGMQGLRRDPYYLLQQPPSFVTGEIPCDGTTIQREGTTPKYFLV
ncbi:MAG TPA: hypothetical protein DD714_00340 [Candidatus Omnitrophica bacterium]|nr:hypothetical protein [Candidatus Omnitrophota bacterium]